MEKAYRFLEMPTAYPSLVPLPPAVSDINTKKKEKAYGNSLKHRVSEAWRQEVLQVSPSLPAGSQPEGRMAAFVNHTHTNLFRNLSTPAPYVSSFSADSAYYLFKIRTQDQNIIPTCPCVSTLADTLIVELRARLPWWDAYTKQQQMAVL